MASWGLAFEHGKKAYEEMWKQQEENDRLAATRELFDLKNREETEAMRDTLSTNSKARYNNAIVNKYSDKLRTGDKKAFVDCMNELSSGTGVKYSLGKNGKMTVTDSDGNKSTVDLNGKEWSGAAMLSATQYWAQTPATTAAEYRESEKSNQEMKYKRDSLANQLQIARIYAGARGAASDSPDGKKPTAPKFTKDDIVAAAPYAVRAGFGAGATGSKNPETGAWDVQINGSPVALTPSQVEALEKNLGNILVHTANKSSQKGLGVVAMLPIAANELFVQQHKAQTQLAADQASNSVLNKYKNESNLPAQPNDTTIWHLPFGINTWWGKSKQQPSKKSLNDFLTENPDIARDFNPFPFAGGVPAPILVRAE